MTTVRLSPEKAAMLAEARQRRVADQPVPQPVAKPEDTYVAFSQWLESLRNAAV